MSGDTFKTLNFQRLSIHKSYTGQIVGTLEVEGASAVVSLKLTPALCEAVMEVCADNLVFAASEIADKLKQETRANFIAIQADGAVE